MKTYNFFLFDDEEKSLTDAASIKNMSANLYATSLITEVLLDDLSVLETRLKYYDIQEIKKTDEIKVISVDIENDLNDKLDKFAQNVDLDISTCLRHLFLYSFDLFDTDDYQELDDELYSQYMFDEDD